jgi:hypothetical protein
MANFLNYDKKVKIIERFEDHNYWHEVSIIDSLGFRIRDHLNTIFVGGIQTYLKATRFDGHNFGEFFQDLNITVSQNNSPQEKKDKISYASNTLDFIRDMFHVAVNWRWYQYDTRSQDSVNYKIAHIIIGQLYENVYQDTDGFVDGVVYKKFTDIILKDSYLILLALDEFIVDPNEFFPEDVLLDYI